jgi:hypothetical protein
MGTIFGKSDVAEPSFTVLYDHPMEFNYQIRHYGIRYGAQVLYTNNNNNTTNNNNKNSNENENDSDNTPFMELARYIGVFGTPENEQQTSMAMTAPVVMERRPSSESGIKISMTAPVIRTTTQTKEIEEEQEEEEATGKTIIKKTTKKMMFVLPAEYDSIEKIPIPTNPDVQIVEIPAEVGVVHRYSGSFDETKALSMATDLATQLHKDGVNITTEYAMDHYQFWGYNPPFTIPMFRRNEVWIPLTETQLAAWQSNFIIKEEN